MSTRNFDWGEFWGILPGLIFWGAILLSIFWTPISDFYSIVTKGTISCTTIDIPFETDTVDADWLLPSESSTDSGHVGERELCKHSNGTVKSDTVIKKPVNATYYNGTRVKPSPIPIYQESGGGAICNDGTRSYSTGRGTCSWHGGVSYYL